MHPNEIAASRDFIGEFVGRLLPKSPVRPTLVVFPAPSLDLAPSVFQGQEPIYVQTFLPQATAERFYLRVVSGLSGPAEIERHAVSVGPLI